MFLLVETENVSKSLDNAEEVTAGYLISFIYGALSLPHPKEAISLRKGQEVLSLLKEGKVKISFQDKDGQKEYVIISNNPLVSILESTRNVFETNRRKVLDILKKIPELSFSEKEYIANLITGKINSFNLR